MNARRRFCPSFSPIPSAPFKQITVVDDFLFTVYADEGVILPGLEITIERKYDDEFKACVHKALGLENADEYTHIYHKIFSLADVSVSGEAQVRVNRLDFTDLLAQYPGAGIAVYVLRYFPEEAFLADRAQTMYRDVDVEQNQVEFTITRMGLYDVVAVITEPAPTPTPTPEVTEEPNDEPSAEPTEETTEEPTEEPADEVTPETTEEVPTDSPAAPTDEISDAPADQPSGESTLETDDEPSGEQTEDASPVDADIDDSQITENQGETADGQQEEEQEQTVENQQEESQDQVTDQQQEEDQEQASDGQSEETSEQADNNQQEESQGQAVDDQQEGTSEPPADTQPEENQEQPADTNPEENQDQETDNQPEEPQDQTDDNQPEEPETTSAPETKDYTATAETVALSGALASLGLDKQPAALEVLDGDNVVFTKSTTNNPNMVRNVIRGISSEIEIEYIPEGAIRGLFSVSASTKVWFSQGNLQYQGSTNTWRFAENQWDYVGNASGNALPSATQSNWMDLFGWGTSGYHDNSDTYNTNYYPYSASTSTVNTSYNYYGYGPSSNMTDPNLVGTSANYDWGVYNDIKAGDATIAAGTYRTLTEAEWYYLRYSRTNAANLFGEGSVSGVNGCIFLPDDWTLPDGLTFTAGQSAWSNSYTVTQWEQMESAGAVFLPAAGHRSGTSASVIGAGSYGYYWSSTYRDSRYAYTLYFTSGQITMYENGFYRFHGRSVRLVRVAE